MLKMCLINFSYLTKFSIISMYPRLVSIKSNLRKKIIALQTNCNNLIVGNNKCKVKEDQNFHFHISNA